MSYSGPGGKNNKGKGKAPASASTGGAAKGQTKSPKAPSMIVKWAPAKTSQPTITLGKGSKGSGGHGSSSSVVDNTNEDKPTVERKFRQLARMMMNSTPFSLQQAEEFLTLGNQVLDSEFLEFRQRFIQDLAGESGLRRVAEIVEANYQRDGVNAMNFWIHCVPFLKIISHEKVRFSLVLENAIGTIYNIIYGQSASRAVPFFQMIVQHLTSTTNPETFQSLEFGDALYATSRALWMTMTFNQSASVQTEFVDITKSIRGCLERGNGGYSIRAADVELRKVEQRLNIAEAIPLASTHLPPPPKQQTTLPSRIIDFDFPGNRSEKGPRHDNDSDSIVDIKILPTRSEIMNLERTEYLPIRDYSPTAHHLPPGMRRVLDTQFRLLREDTAGQVREALQYLGDTLTKKPAKGTGGAKKNPEVINAIGAQILVHRNILFEAFKIDDREGLQLNVSFDQPPRLTAENMDAAERKRWWTHSRSMQTGNLVCLVDQHKQFTFFTISERIVTGDGNQQGRTNIHDLSSHPTRALVTLKLIDIKNDLDNIIEEYHQHSRYYDDYPVLSMLEFPGMLFASFGPILEYLRNIVAVGGEEAVPFHRLIAPEGNRQKGHPAEDPEKKGFIKIAPPAYLRGGFTLDLSVLKDQEAGGRLTHSVNQQCSIPTLQAVTTLDRGQCEALLGALTRELALIQGPPGTGKSYVGVQLVRVLLHNNSKLNLGPIICVCYTNHALDQFLVDLLQHGVSRLVRIGARSQSPEIEPFTLRHVVQRVRTSYPEREAIRNMKSMVDATQKEIRHLCFRLSRAHHWTALKSHLEARYPKIHEQLFAVLEGKPDKEGFTLKTYHKPDNIIDDWINLRYLPQIPSLDRYISAPQLSSMTLEQLMNSDLSVLSRPQRMQMKEYWEDEIKSTIHTELKRAIAKFYETKEALETSYQDRARNCLQGAEIVGVTTTGLAGHADLLRNIQAKVLICEEAGEVLEAHTITALLPSVQHAILIGDHQQLRPHISNYSLSMESRQGVYYSLDESLFERLIRQRYGADDKLRFPFATLDTQRRMYPSISNLVRQTLYPHLKDHPSVHEHPEVEGMARRLFWFDHTQLENNADNKDPTVTSKTNEFEVSMVTALVTHLVKQGCYEEGEIAVITPYLGQLMRLRRQLENIYQVVLGDKDQEEVELAGLVGDLRPGATAPEAATANTTQSEVPKEKPKRKLRLSTVDNFQGEEAKVIVVSLVRCNPARRCGFLKTSNRINVLLSRARHGMYIVGNSDTARPVQMWSEVLTLFARDGNIAETMQLRCPRHQQKQIIIRTPEDFLRYAPDGGCEVPCGRKLDECQHLCPDFCHSEALHHAVICPQKCQRKLPGCNHRCRATCGERCPECIVNISQVLLPCEHLCYNIPCHQAQVPEDIMCMTPVVQRVPRCGHEHIEPCSVDITDEEYQCVTPCDLQLSCGHIASNIPCHQTRTPEEVVCQRSVTKTVPRCGHTKDVACHFDIANPEYKCDTICGEELECGHACQGRCWECNQGKLHLLADEDDHVPCRTPCGRLHEPCGHACTKACHADLECGTCDRPCDFGCSHSRCPKGCGETCVPCVLPCKSSCNHRGKCKMPCAHPCNVLPCDKRCLRRLRCGHQCPSLCGEACPEAEFCQHCATPDVRSRIVDTHRQTKYEKADLNANPVIVPPCGHLLSVNEMDKLMRMEEVYEYQGGNIVKQRPLQEWINNHLERTQIQCPECTFPFDESSNRYNRISKCATMVGLTNRLIADASKQFLSLEQQIEQFERQSKDTRTEFAHNFIATSTEGTEFGIGGITINHLAPMIAERHKDIAQLIKSIQEFIASTTENEQPFLMLYAQVSAGSRPRNPRTPSTSTLDDLSVNPRYRLLAQVLYLRLEWARILDIFEIARLGELQRYQTDIRRTVQTIPLLLPSLQSDCKRLEAEASAALQYAQCIEAKLFHARFTALELALPPRSYRFIPPPPNVTFYPRQEDENRAYVTMKRNREIANLTEALTTCINHPLATRGLRPVVEQGLQILPGESVFRDPAVTKEQQMLYAAMRGREWAETKEWIFCVNRHPLAKVEIGTPLSTAKCPQCEQPLAGQGQGQANVGRGSRRTNDLDLQFGRMRI